MGSLFTAILLGTSVMMMGAASSLLAQGKGEELGSDDSGGKAIYLHSEMHTLPSKLEPQYADVHPRVYFTASELDALRARAHGGDKEWWQRQLASLRVLHGPPPAPPAEGRREQNDVALAIAEAAFAYQIERQPRLLELAKQYMDAAVSYPVWGYSWSKPNVDLAAGHLLYGMGVAYDLLYPYLTSQEREKYRSCIAHHGQLMYENFAPKPGRRWTYSQNHTFIPISGLAVAAYALYGEVPEAEKWAALSRAIFSRVLETYSKDGYYYEGFEYWIFATPWIVHYLDALKHATGEDLFDQPGLRSSHLYAAHSMAPGGQLVFDFGDVYEGAETRAHKGEAYPRSHPDGHFETNYNLLYDLAARFHDPEIQGVADWLRSLGQTSQEEWWTLAWRDPKLASKPIAQVEPWHWFRDHDVVFWRSGWGADATAIAFKCGPPEGHATTELMRKFPDWRLEDGHAHPDANSFIIWAHGAYLTGNSGYAGVPRSIGASTLLVDGKGQGHEGTHNAWAAFPYEQLNRARITKAVLSANGFDLEGEAAGVYDPPLGLTEFRRELKLTTTGKIVIEDHVASSKPDTYSEVLHADEAVTEKGHADFELHGYGGSLGAVLKQPDDFNQAIEKNMVLGPGAPGSVDKGSWVQRGERLLVSTKTPQQSGHFIWALSF